MRTETVWDGSDGRGGFPAEQTPSGQRHFQPGSRQRPAASMRLSPLAVPRPRRTSNLSNHPTPPAESPTFSTKTPAPSFQTLSRTSEDNRSPSHVSGTPKPLPVLLEAFNFKKKRIAATVFKSLILYSYFVHY